MNRVIINGERAHLHIDGMNRVLLEMTKSLDSIEKKDRYILVIPADASEEFCDGIKGLRDIKVKKTILPYFRFWSLLFVDMAGLFPHRTVINLHNRNSVFGGGINLLNDIIPIRFYGEQGSRYLKRIERLVRTSNCLIVPSESTRDDIKATMDCRHDIEKVYLGWQHYRYIREDDEIFDEYPCLEKGSYYYAVSTISPHKNIRFLYEVAKRNPDRMFVVTGSMNRGYGFEYSELQNLLFTGRISDGKAKALMNNCRAFIFSSLYEGAGLPPLEALSCGVPVLAADIKVVHEYCGDSVHYIDPLDYDIDIEDILKVEVAEPEQALDKLSWDKAALELKNIIESYE